MTFLDQLKIFQKVGVFTPLCHTPPWPRHWDKHNAKFLKRLMLEWDLNNILIQAVLLPHQGLCIGRMLENWRILLFT